MDRIELDKEIELEQYQKKQFKPLDFTSKSLSREKKIYAPRNKIEALKHEIYEFFKPYPEPKIDYGFLCGIIKEKTYDRAEAIFRKLQSDMKDQRSSIQNSSALWLRLMFPKK
jgi:hypothetical protein